jgi:hypothetical protein
MASLIGAMPMTATLDSDPKCVLIVSDDPAVRAFARNTVIGETRYVFDCKLADLAVMIRSIRIDALVVVSDRAGATIKQLREALVGARIPPRRVAVVESAGDVRDVVLTALAT